MIDSEMSGQCPQLRVFTADGESRDFHEGGLTPVSTLSVFFSAWGRRCLEDRGAAEQNVAQYAESVRIWAEATGDPSLKRIRRSTISAFRRHLESRPGLQAERLSPNTVLKHLVAIKAVLRWAGPRTGNNGEAYSKRGLFGADEDGDPRLAPNVPLPARTTKTPDPFSLEDIGHWLRACEAARAPRIRGVAAADWWRALILFSYNVGTRIETTLKITRAMIRGKWLVIPASAVKGHRADLKIWLNAFALRAAVAIQSSGNDRLFAWPHTRNYFAHVQAEIIRNSEIPEAERYGGTHRLRKALATWLTGHNPAVARMQLGHSLAGDVLLAHYANPQIVKRLMERVPQPDCGWPATPDDPQMMLF